MKLPPRNHLQTLLADINACDHDRLQAFSSFQRADRSTLEASRLYASAVIRPLLGAGFDAAPRDPVGAAAVIQLLSAHPAFAEGRPVQVGSAVLGPQSADPAEFDARREAAEFLLVGISAFAFQGISDDGPAGALVGVAFGADAFSRSVRDAVLGLRGGLDLDGNDLIPSRLIDLATLDRVACVRGIQDAAVALSLGFRPGRAWSTGITAIDRPVGCAGDSVVIRGSGFGKTRPAGVVVMFPKQGGGCTEAEVTSWTDAEVTVVVPDSAGQGCIGFAEGGTPGDVEAASTFAGVLEQCIGPAAFRVAEKVRYLGGVAPPPPCPDCPRRAVNRFRGGKPVIDFFTANQSHAATVQPGESVVLRWSVRNAQTITLARSSMQGPFAPPPVPLPAAGDLDLGPFNGTSPVTATYELTAANGCATETYTVTVQLNRVPSLSIAAIEVVQVIQSPLNIVRLVSRKRTVARVFVDSGITGGFDYGSGPNIAPGIVGNVTVYPAGRGFGTPGTPLNPGTALGVPTAVRNRDLASHSLIVELPFSDLDGQVRIDAQVAVAGHENDVGGPWKAFSSTTVVFEPRPFQEVLPMLLSDNLNGFPAPSTAAYVTSLQEARKRYPLEEVGFIINPPMTLPASNAAGQPYNMSRAGDWDLLLTDLQIAWFVFPSTPVGGIRTALLPRNGGGLTDAAGNSIPRYALNGIGIARFGLYAPTMICQSGLTGTFAHEMGHTRGIGHAPCPAPPGTPGSGDCSDPPAGIDSRLPGGTDDVGFDVPAGVVIPIGRGEMMSYCGDLSRCPGPTRWPSTVTYSLLF